MALYVPPQENDDFYNSKHPPLEGDPTRAPLPLGQPSDPVILATPERDLRKQTAEPGKTGFTGKTQAELWAHLKKIPAIGDAPSIGQIVNTIESEIIARNAAMSQPNAGETPGHIQQNIDRNIRGLEKALREARLGNRVTDNLLRVEMPREMARLEKKHAVSALQALDAMPEHVVVEWVGERVAAEADTSFAARAANVAAASARYDNVDLGGIAGGQNPSGRGR